MSTTEDMKLYAVHCGFTDSETGFGVYESHTNMFVVAPSPRDARQHMKGLALFKNKKMHIDGIHEIEAVQGFRVKLEKTAEASDSNVIHTFEYDELNAMNDAVNS